MKEYTLLSTAAVLCALALDHASGIRVSRTRSFWIFSVLMMSAAMTVNGFLTACPVFLYDQNAVSGLRLGTIPVEDFIFAFAFSTFTLTAWEFFSRRDLAGDKKGLRL